MNHWDVREFPVCDGHDRQRSVRGEDNNRLPSDRHITLAWGRDYADLSPLRGVILGGGDHPLAVSVDVSRVSA